MGRAVDFTIRGKRLSLLPADIEAIASRLQPDELRKHAVVIRGRRFPPKQVFAVATGLDVLDFTTNDARRVFIKLGFPVERVG
jgi:hypothetical protein